MTREAIYDKKRSLKITGQYPEELPLVPQKAGETVAHVTILDDSIEGRPAEKDTIRVK